MPPFVHPPATSRGRVNFLQIEISSSRVRARINGQGAWLGVLNWRTHALEQRAAQNRAGGHAASGLRHHARHALFHVSRKTRARQQISTPSGPTATTSDDECSLAIANCAVSSGMTLAGVPRTFATIAIATLAGVLKVTCGFYFAP